MTILLHKLREESESVSDSVENQNSPTTVLQGQEWFLGFDATCGAGSNYSDFIDQGSDGIVAAVSLHEPMVRDWIEQTSGSTTSLRPTLFRVRGEKIEAWTGHGLFLRLTQVLGPKRAWRLAESVGEMKSDVITPESSGRFDRRRMLTGLSGIAAGLLLAQGVRDDVSAHSPSSCGVGFKSEPASWWVEGGSRCRHCPFLSSSVDGALLTEGWYGFLGFTEGGSWVDDPVNGRPYRWWRTDGPRGCWVHNSLLSWP